MSFENEQLRKKVTEIVQLLRMGEVNYAYSLYPGFINLLEQVLTDEKKVNLQKLFQEILKAQESRNTVWLADLMEYMLLPEIE